VIRIFDAAQYASNAQRARLRTLSQSMKTRIGAAGSRNFPLNGFVDIVSRSVGILTDKFVRLAQEVTAIGDSVSVTSASALQTSDFPDLCCPV